MSAGSGAPFQPAGACTLRSPAETVRARRRGRVVAEAVVPDQEAGGHHGERAGAEQRERGGRAPRGRRPPSGRPAARRLGEGRERDGRRAHRARGRRRGGELARGGGTARPRVRRAAPADHRRVRRRTSAPRRRSARRPTSAARPGPWPSLARHVVEPRGQLGPVRGRAAAADPKRARTGPPPRPASGRDRPGEALVEDARRASRRRCGGRAPPVDLLGRDVVDRADEVAGLGQARLVGALGQSEVGEERVVAAADQHVLGLDVAVDQADAVRRVERLGDRRQDLQRPARRRARGR